MPLQVMHFGIEEVDQNYDYFGNKSTLELTKPLMAIVVLYLSNATRGGEKASSPFQKHRLVEKCQAHGWIDTLAASDCLHCAGLRLPWSYTAQLPEVRVILNEIWMCFLVFYFFTYCSFWCGYIGFFYFSFHCRKLSQIPVCAILNIQSSV